MTSLSTHFTVQHNIAGNLTASATGVFSYAVPFGAELVRVSANAATAPVGTGGADLVLKKNGTTFATLNLPTTVASATLTPTSGIGTAISGGSLAPTTIVSNGVTSGTNNWAPTPAADSVIATFAAGDTLRVDTGAAIGATTPAANVAMVFTFLKK